MIESITFENVNGATFTFNSNIAPFNELTTEVQQRSEGASKAREHGVWPYMTYYDERVIRGEGDILRTTSAEYIQTRLDMFRALRPSPHLGNRVVGRLRLTLTGQEEMETYCTLDGYPELPMQGLGPAHSAYMVAFRSFDPRVYSIAEYSAQANLVAVSSGRVFPKVFPVTYAGSPASGATLILTNSGNEASPKVAVDVYGPVTGPQFILDAGGNSFVVALDELIINTGEIATVDFVEKTATLNTGQELDRFITQRDWWMLEPGNNNVRFNAFAASSPSRAVFRWKNAYMI